jgi:hypothetical protein
MAILKPLLLHFLLMLIIFLLILLRFPELFFFLRKGSELEITNFPSLQCHIKIRQNPPTDFPVEAYERSDRHGHP